tara:strand:+ start:195 stop:416 length:222 start_codon:yes stop_codon:yes gene_type:complete
MKSKVRQKLISFFFILITNTQVSQAHNYLNGGCKNHCERSFLKNNLEKKLENFNNKNQIKDNYSCLKKSLCRG